MEKLARILDTNSLPLARTVTPTHASAVGSTARQVRTRSRLRKSIVRGDCNRSSPGQCIGHRLGGIIHQPPTGPIKKILVSPPPPYSIHLNSPPTTRLLTLTTP